MDVNFLLGALVCNWDKVEGLNFIEKSFFSHKFLVINQVDFISLDFLTFDHQYLKQSLDLR